MIRFVTYLSILSAFFISPNLLYVLGIQYITDVGSPFEKIHIATYMAAFLVVLVIIRSNKLVLTSISPAALGLCVACLFFVILSCIARDVPFTAIVVTNFTPVLFVILIDRLSGADRKTIGKMVYWLLVINSLWAIAEQTTGFRPLPRLAGTTVYMNDPRSIGFLGHPLTSAVMTASMIIFMVISAINKMPSAGTIVVFGIHLLAIVFFGGRLSLVATALLVAVYIVFDGKVSGRRARAGMWKRLLIFAAICAGLGAVLVSGLADGVIGRFGEDDGSALTRMESLQILLNLPFSQMIVGFTAAEKYAIAQNLGARAFIEVTWISWLIDYGIIATIGLLLSLTITLRAALKNSERQHKYMVVLFLTATTGFLGLGSKTLLLTWFVIMMMTVRRSSQVASTLKSEEPKRMRTDIASAHHPKLGPDIAV